MCKVIVLVPIMYIFWMSNGEENKTPYFFFSVLNFLDYTIIHMNFITLLKTEETPLKIGQVRRLT